MSVHLLSLVLFGEGLLTGITLTAMLGPVTMMILRYGIQVNRVAGVWAAAGTWVSDFVFIGFTYWLTASIAAWADQPSVQLWIYIAGGCGLILMGLWLTRAKRRNIVTNEIVATRTYAQAFAAGFLVNSLSPFTLFFWIGAALLLHLQPHNPFWYYSGLMITLGIGDFFKAWLAPKLNMWIRDKYVYWVQVIAGVVIAITGVYMIGLGVFS